MVRAVLHYDVVSPWTLFAYAGACTPVLAFGETVARLRACADLPSPPSPLLLPHLRVPHLVHPLARTRTPSHAPVLNAPVPGCTRARAVLKRYRQQWDMDLVLKPVFLGGVMNAAGNKPPITVPNKGKWMNQSVRGSPPSFS